MMPGSFEHPNMTCGAVSRGPLVYGGCDEGSDVERLDNRPPRSLDFRPLWDQACAQINMLEELGTLEGSPEAVVRRTLVGVLIHALQHVDSQEADQRRITQQSEATEAELAELAQQVVRGRRSLVASVNETKRAYKGTSEAVLNAISDSIVRIENLTDRPSGISHERWLRLLEMQL